MKIGIFSVVAAAAIFTGSVGATGQTHKKSPAQNKKAALICPVTGDKIASPKTAKGHSTYKGKTYYFCCGMCKPRFDKVPGKYVTNAARGKFEKM